MKPATRRVWWPFALCLLAGAAALVWITMLVAELERGQRRADLRATHQATLRLALWRMDSWLAPLLAREAARPPNHWQSYYRQPDAYNRVLSKLAPDEIRAPSPLLTFRSDLFPLHFELDAQGQLSSPQVPTGNWRDLAEGNLPDIVDIDQNGNVLERLRGVLDVATIARHCGAATAVLAMQCGTAGDAPAVALPPSPLDFENRNNLWLNAQQAANPAQNFVPPPVPDETGVLRGLPGPLVPLWFGAKDDVTLVFMRRAQATDSQSRYQGFVADWSRLRRALLQQTADLLDPTATSLEPVRDDSPTSSDQLAVVPAQLRAPPPAEPLARASATRGVLIGVWIAALLVALAVGFTLHSTLALGERRARFASTVTHELRTPLTTFRMYSDMLAEGMVPDPDKRQEYLNTLRREADRLSRLVENVLCYARLEDGRFRGRREPMRLGDLLAQVLPTLLRRAEETGAQLEVDHAHDAIQVNTDPDAVAQILFNLVDNACKYAITADGDNQLVLRVEVDAQHAHLLLCDHGPGVPTAQARAVFAPFERAGRAAGDNDTPGVGLGLALARGLARDLGGDLVLRRPEPGGACFALRLPRVRGVPNPAHSTA